MRASLLDMSRRGAPQAAQLLDGQEPLPSLARRLLLQTDVYSGKHVARQGSRKSELTVFAAVIAVSIGMLAYVLVSVYVLYWRKNARSTGQPDTLQRSRANSAGTPVLIQQPEPCEMPILVVQPGNDVMFAHKIKLGGQHIKKEEDPASDQGHLHGDNVTLPGAAYALRQSLHVAATDAATVETVPITDATDGAAPALHYLAEGRGTDAETGHANADADSAPAPDHVDAVPASTRINAASVATDPQVIIKLPPILGWDLEAAVALMEPYTETDAPEWLTKSPSPCSSSAGGTLVLSPDRSNNAIAVSEARAVQSVERELD